MRTYISLLKVDINYNSLVTNKHRLNFKKTYNQINYTYPILVVNLLQRLNGLSPELHSFIFALNISNYKESFIATDTFSHN